MAAHGGEMCVWCFMSRATCTRDLWMRLWNRHYDYCDNQRLKLFTVPETPYSLACREQ